MHDQTTFPCLRFSDIVMTVAFKFCGSSAGYIFTVQIHWQMPSDAAAADGLQ